MILQPDKLLGYELYTSPYVPTAQSGALTIAFGDFKNYWIGDRAGRTVQRLNSFTLPIFAISIKSPPNL